MGSEETTSPTPHGKHRRSTDEAPEESSKRRRHHRHHHRRHRHHGRERDERTGLLEASMKPPKRPEDDDLEEGEIIEDDGGKAVVVSDVESGEIKLDAADPVTSMEEDGSEEKGLEAMDVAQNETPNGSIVDNVKQVKSYQSPSFPHGKSRGNNDSDPVLKGREALKSHHTRGEELHGKTVKEGESCTYKEHELKSYGGVEKEKYREADESESGRDTRSRSPVFGESLHSLKDKRRDERDDGDLDCDFEKLALKWQDLNKKNRHISPDHTGDRYSVSRRHDEVHRRERSKSRDQNERTGRNESDLEHGRGHDRRDRYSSRSRANDKEDRRERERSASYSRQDSREGRHGSRGRNRESDDYARSLRDRDNPEIGKELQWERERERSSSYSRRDIREDRHVSRDRAREGEKYISRTRDIDREDYRKRDTSRDKYLERERERDINRERERSRDGDDRDRSRGRDREVHRDRHRDRGGRRESWSSRHDLEERKDRTRIKESATETNQERHDLEAVKEKSFREEDVEDYQERIEQQLAKQDEEDIDKIKEESRKRRQAILEKYKQQPQQNVLPSSKDNVKDEKASVDENNVQKLSDNGTTSQAVCNGPEFRSDAADVYAADSLFILGKSPVHNGAASPERTAGGGGLGDGTPKSERSADMFCDDIFGESPATIRKPGKGDGIQIERSGLHDNWDDAEGYYSYRFGEVLDGRYEVVAAHGKGVFSTVVRAKDLKAGKGDPEEVAIKIIRNNDTMYKAGLEELIILKKLAGADPDDKRHCVRFLSSFKYRNHLCLVFESLHMNLREVLKKFGRNIGLKLTAVRAYAKQLFIALKHLRNCGVLHCDIKPDNMLVNEAKNVLKLCDFGNAMFAGKNEITPYLVSRFYRAPEIILGLQYDHPMDIWSVGCCLYELYTGKVLFPGPSNNDMLRLHMELKGSFPKKMLRKGAFADQHFDQDLNFHATEEDPVTKKTVKRLLLNIKPKDIGALISGSPGEDPKMLTNFKDLLERIFLLDPEKRMTVSQALSHPFITGK